MRRIGLVGLLLVMGGTVQDAGAAAVCGRVMAAGKPLAGAFLLLDEPARQASRVRATDAAGVACFDASSPAPHRLGASAPGYLAAPASETAAGTATTMPAIHLEPDPSPAEQLSAYAWLAALPNDAMKARFIGGCTICHDPGAAAVRRPRDRAAWVEVIQRMRSQVDIYGVVPHFDEGEMADWLVEHRFGVAPTTLQPSTAAANGNEGSEITLYRVGDADSWAHDMAIEPATGAAWVGDYPYDQLIRIDPVSGARRVHAIPVKGGGAHTLHFDHDGMLWVTLQLADAVARFDPRSGEFRIYRGFQRGSLIHSFAYDGAGLIKRDARGLIWMSEFGTNAVASLDPASGAIREYRLGGETGHTYGIALDSRDRVWFTKYSENVFGMFDPADGTLVERHMPRPDSAPHRMTIDTADRLWIPNSAYGTLACYDIVRDRLSEIPLPEPDTYPYAARYDAATGSVWVVGNGADALYRFEPAQQTFTRYRLPVGQAYARMIAFDPRGGEVWTSLSNYPNRHTGRDHTLLVRLSVGTEAPPSATP